MKSPPSGIAGIIDRAAASCAGLAVTREPPRGRFTIRNPDPSIYELVSPDGDVVQVFHDTDARGWDPCFWLGAPPKAARRALAMANYNLVD